jgi:hypothetical protein
MCVRTLTCIRTASLASTSTPNPPKHLLIDDSTFISKCNGLMTGHPKFVDAQRHFIFLKNAFGASSSFQGV